MKYLFILALLGGGWFAYKSVMTDSPAVAAYKQFADSMAQDNFDRAAGLAEGKAAEYVQTVKDQRFIPRGQVMSGFKGMFSQGGKQQLADLRGTSDVTDYQVKSQTKRSDGSVEIDAQQTDRRSSPEGSAPRVFFWHHKATVANTGGAWKIVEFSEESAR